VVHNYFFSKFYGPPLCPDSQISCWVNIYVYCFHILFVILEYFFFSFCGKVDTWHQSMLWKDFTPSNLMFLVLEFFYLDHNWKKEFWIQSKRASSLLAYVSLTGVNTHKSLILLWYCNLNVLLINYTSKWWIRHGHYGTKEMSYCW
jgi:hypothetical protein